MIVTKEEFYALWGAWTPERIRLARKLVDEPTNCWTEKQLTLGEQLSSAIDEIERLNAIRRHRATR